MSDKVRIEFEEWYRGIPRPNVPESYIDMSLAFVFKDKDSGGIWDAYYAAFAKQQSIIDAKDAEIEKLKSRIEVQRVNIEALQGASEW